MVNRNSAPPPGACCTVIVAAVRLDQALDDEQAEACATAALRAPELAEHAGGELGRDARALVANRHRDTGGACDHRRLDHSSNRTSTVPDCVLNKVGQDLVDLVGVQPGLGQLAARPRP